MEATMAQAADILKNGDGFTILCHQKPDGDTLGSGFALYHALRQMGKRARIRCGDGFPPLYSFLYGDCAPDEANVSFGDNGAAGFQEEIVVAVDVASLSLLGELQKEYEGRINLAVDHHFSNERFAGHNWVDGEAAAAGEMVWDLLGAMGAEITPVIAACLYTAIVTDTGCFRYANTSPKTHRVVARLLEGGLDPQPINQAMFETKSPGRIAFEAEVLQNIRYYHGGRCAVIFMDETMEERFGLSDTDLEGMASRPRQVAGVLAGVTIRSRGGACRISLRTNAPISAADICAAFGGGGHLRAAGCTIPGPPDQAEAQIVAEVYNHLPPEA